MPSPQLIAFLASLAVLAIGGLISNGFIVAVIVIEWARSRKLDAREQLLLSLGMSNIGYSAFPCSITVVASLYRHVYKVTGKGSNVRSLQTDAHTKAAGTVLLLLILSISFYAAKILFLTGYINKDIVAISVCLTLILMYSPVQAALLVLVNPKLKQAAARMLPRAKP
ncbi:taste receptor type 2 member 10-like [Lacerta agilis]|uniref:taste receptor type 2 member 10-like n=1 Tax=Lacerta agilis TaxID=80427 RepID=UPI001419CA42|nr:taste receptor type 2 member 10-like [Lacerta agilis]